VLRLAAVAVAALALTAGVSAAPAQRTLARPNILVIMTDDQSVETMPVMRNVRHLLVEKGATFDNSFTSFPLCCPSRATFLTGQYAHNTHVLGNNLANGLARFDQTRTLPVWLSAAGYRTAFVGKYLNEYRTLEGRKVPPGWSDWNAGLTLSYFNHTMNRNGRVVRYGSAPADYQTDVYTRIAVQSIAATPRSQPLFMWLSYFAPHYGGPREPGDPADLKSTVAAPRHQAKFPNVQLPRDPSFNEADLSDKPAAIRARPPLGEENVAQMTQTYRKRLQSLLAVDEGVAKVIGELKRTGRLDDTLILYTSDNGWLQGQHRIQNAKELPYEPSIRVPLVVRGPGVPANAHLPQLVVNADLAPTILAAAHATPTLVQDGLSLLPLFAAPATSWSRDILLERGPGGNSTGATRLYTGLRTQRYVYLEYASGERELYDLQTDPFELESKHDDPAYAAVETELAQRLALLRDCAGLACQQDF
jgi:N-acetylglucosamine-6-sulfatase